MCPENVQEWLECNVGGYQLLTDIEIRTTLKEYKSLETLFIILSKKNTIIMLILLNCPKAQHNNATMHQILSCVQFSSLSISHDWNAELNK